MRRPDRHAATPVTAEVRKAAERRIDRLLRSPIGPRLLGAVSWGLAPLKELSESLAVFDVAVSLARVRGWDLGDPAIEVLVVGDGRSPRTGALFALKTGWRVTSLDPLMRVEGDHPRVQRLRCVRAKLEDEPRLHAHLVVAPHSHAPADATRCATRPGGHVVVMPCCVPWPVGPGTEVRVSGACTAPDRTIYLERAPEVPACR